MSIKQNFTLRRAVIACVLIILVAELVILNLRSGARTAFLDCSAREIRLVVMQLFLEGISQNVEFLPPSSNSRLSTVGMKSYA